MLKLPTIFFLITLTFLGVIHVIAMELFLYWRFWWFDIPMHFFGGAVVALGLFALHDLRMLVPQRFLRLLNVVLLVLIVALVWEVYEILIGVPMEDDYVFDTLLDLFLGILGALVGYTIGINVKKL